MADNDNAPTWQLLPKLDGLFLSWEDEDGITMVNLGPKEQAMSRLADFLAEQDFGE